MKISFTALTAIAATIFLLSCATPSVADRDGETHVGGVNGATSGRTHQGAILHSAGGRSGD